MGRQAFSDGVLRRYNDAIYHWDIPPVEEVFIDKVDCFQAQQKSSDPVAEAGGSSGQCQKGRYRQIGPSALDRTLR